MTDRHTLTILDWHDDGSSTSSFWYVTTEESEQVRSLLERAPHTEGVVTPDQADEARTITRQWLTFKNENPAP